MDRSYVTVHVGRDERERIRERTDPGESVEDWVRDAIHRRLDADEEGARDGSDDGETTAEATATWQDDDEPGYEFVDDCGL